MSLRADILARARKNATITSRELVSRHGVSRQYVNEVIHELVAEGELVKVGSTRSAFYVHPRHPAASRAALQKRLATKGLKEHEVLASLEKRGTLLASLPENVRSIFAYAFSEMLNNAIEHSRSASVDIAVEKDKDLVFRVHDVGVGVFRNVLKKRKLRSELEAMQDLLKGKTTTAPQAHSGEGIFFTSKAADVFTLESFGYKLLIDNKVRDVFFEETTPSKRGTTVTFRIAIDSQRHLIDVFKRYQSDPAEHAFDKTEIQIRLYVMGTIHISRSQARRVLAGLDKFRLIVLDFDRVPSVGQAFADEVFRVFRNTHPGIEIRPVHMNEAVRFMVERVGE